MTEAELSGEIKTGTVGGLYFFWGDEDFMKNHRALDIKKQVLSADGTADAFNSFSFVFGEGECDIPALSDALMAPPMMSERKFISVFFSSLDSLKEKQRTSLVSLLREFGAGEGNVTVVTANGDGFRGMDGRRQSPMLAEMNKIAKCVEFDYQSETRLIRWMARHIESYGLAADDGVLRAVLSLCGRSMYRLSGEIAKVAAHAAAAGKTAVDYEDVRECVIQNDVDDAFAMTEALLRGDTSGALASLKIKIKKREEPIVVLGQISRTISDMCSARAFIDDGRDKSDFASAMKMNEYRAGKCYRAAGGVSAADLALASSMCRDADRLLKSGAGGYMPIERLICLAGGRLRRR